jgi:hypothetical protein
MKNVAVHLLSLLALGAPALAGCNASLDLINVQEGCPEMPLRGPESYAPASPEAVIDDFDDGDLFLKRIAGRAGSWVGFATPTQGTVFGEASSRCVAHGTYSGHLTGNDLAAYGGNWNGVFVDPFSSAIPIDAHTYTGLSFWVASGNGVPLPAEMPIGVMTTDTSAGAGICNPCGDYYRAMRGKAIPLTHTWTRWEVKFVDMVQSGQGSPQVPLRLDQLVTIMIWPEKTYDIWLDDVRFEP